MCFLKGVSNMNKKILMGSLCFMILSANSFATNGYLGSSYSNTLKTDQGECVHSSSFDEQSEHLADCNHNSLK